MVTVVNSPQPENSGDNMWNFLGILVVIVALFVLFYYGLPFIRNSMRTPQVNIPENIDINVNQQE